MNYGSCPCCGKLTKYVKLNLCEDCEKKFIHLVKDYIYENGVRDAKTISKATGVPVRIIEFFINNDYLGLRNSEDQSLRQLEDEEILKKQEQLALIEALQGSFTKKPVQEEPKEEVKGEMHFLTSNRRH